MTKFFQNFLRMEAAGGILLMMAMSLAIVCANIAGVSELYDTIFNTDLHGHTLTVWINDGPMAVFFFLVGLELKREFLEGELSDTRKVMLPVFGAIGGMMVPALFYAAINWGDALAMRGWAIPTATDIAFALGVLTLLGPKVPSSLKVFLTSLAIFDDLGAVLIIAFFYTAKISFAALAAAGCCVVVLAILNRLNVSNKIPYILVGLIMWVATLKSGVHATIAGVVLAMFIPLSTKGGSGESPLKEMEHALHPYVSYLILPIFAFANSGLDLRGMGMDQLLHSVPVGIALGLFVGKQIGVFGACFLAVKMKLARLPEGICLINLYGVSLLCGIGFTMSLFVGSLAFHDAGAVQVFDERIGIIVGSLASGILGYFVIRSTSGAAKAVAPPVEG